MEAPQVIPQRFLFLIEACGGSGELTGDDTVLAGDD
jgi:hypothetical protein